MARVSPQTLNKLLLLAWAAVLVALAIWLEPRLPAAVPGWGLAILGVAAWVASVAVWERRRTRQWSTTAATLGLERAGGPEGSPYTVLGELDDHRISVEVANPKADADPEDDTILRTEAARADPRFRLEVRAMAPLEQAPDDRAPAGEGMSYASMQEPRFDDRFHVRATDPDRARQILTLGARQDLLLVGHDLELIVDGSSVELTIDRRVLEADALRAAMQAVSRIATALERAEGLSELRG